MSDYTLSAKLTGDSSGFEKAFAVAEKAVDNFVEKTKSISSKVENVGKSITGVGKDLLPVSAAISGVGVASGKMALEFEDSMANINTLLDDTTNLKGYEAAVKSLSNDTGISLDIMSAGMYQAISSLGDGGDETNKIFTTMAKSAKAGGAEVSDSVSLISAGMKGYNQVSGETAQKISDLAFQTAKLGVTTFPEMAKSMQPLFPLASSLNLSYEELFGSMATLTGVTGNTAEVSTQLKAVFSNLMAPTESMQQLIEKYGYSSGQAMLESEGLAGMLQIVKNETGGQADKMAALFSSTEAVTAMTALTGAQFDVFGQKLASMSEATGATQTAYDKLNTTGNTLRTSWNLIKNTGVELGTTLINTLAPIITEVSGKIQEFAQWFANLDESQKRTIVTIGLIIAAAAPLLTTLGTLITSIGKIIGVIGSIGSAVSTLGGIVKTAITGISSIVQGLFSLIMAHPVIAVITAVVAAVALLYNKCEWFRDGVHAVVNAVVGFFQNLGSSAATIFTGIFNTASTIFSNIGSFISNVISGISSAISTLTGVFSSIFSSIYSIVTSVMGNVRSFITGVFSGIQSAWTGLTSFVSGVFSGIGSAVQTLVGQVKGFVNGVIGGINAAIGVINMIPGVSIGSIPYLLHGTDDWAGGFARMNEGGRGELIYLPDGTQVIPHDISVKYAKEAAQANTASGYGAIDYDRLINGFADAMKNVQVRHISTLNGRTVAAETLPLIDRGLGDTAGRKVRYAV